MLNKGVFTDKLNRSHLTFFNYTTALKTLFCLSEIFISDGLDSIAWYMKYRCVRFSHYLNFYLQRA